MAVLQGNQQFRALNVSRVISPPVTALLMASYLVIGSHSLALATLTWTVLAWVTAIITSVAVWRGVPRRTSRRDDDRLPSLRTLIGFSLKALLGSVTPLEGFQLDQAIVGIFLSQAALGVYVVAVAFTNLPRFVAQGIGLVGYPHVAAAREGHGTARLIMRFMLTTLVLCGATVGIIEVGLPILVPVLFGKPFHARHRSRSHPPHQRAAVRATAGADRMRPRRGQTRPWERRRGDLTRNSVSGRRLALPLRGPRRRSGACDRRIRGTCGHGRWARCTLAPGPTRKHLARRAPDRRRWRPPPRRE